jgi:voltage-gated sodium channel
MTQYTSALGTVSGDSFDGEMELVGTLINYVLSGIFAMELAISLYAHWWRPFFTSGWKIFDLVIVIVSFLALTSWTPIPPEVARAMRIFRVFGTAESLRRIISPLVSSLIPVANAFAILFVVVAFGA